MSISVYISIRCLFLKVFLAIMLIRDAFLETWKKPFFVNRGLITRAKRVTFGDFLGNASSCALMSGVLVARKVRINLKSRKELRDGTWKLSLEIDLLNPELRRIYGNH